MAYSHRRLLSKVLLGTVLLHGFCFSSAATQLKQPWQTAGWLKLLHYQEKANGAFYSNVRESSFFLTSDGASNPEGEWRALLSDLKAPTREIGVLHQSAACAFPARALFASRITGIEFPKASCEHFDPWRQGLNATSATLVFSTAYSNNPASMFGHTFLRLNHPSGSPMLSYGLGFAAEVPENAQGLDYMFSALLGYYPGRYSLSPYYMKINEYNHHESRDLWEYDLNLQPSEIELLLAHVWEMYQFGVFDYYFLDENCSYQILALLAGVKPEWNLTENWGNWVLPMEAVRRISDIKGAVSEVHFRSSLRRKMQGSYDKLNAQEKQWFAERLRNEVPNAPESATLADALIDAKNFQLHGKHQDPSLDKGFQQLLVQRSQMPASGPDQEEMANNRPDTGHSPAAVSLLGGNSNKGAVFFAEARPLYHDLSEASLGFEPNLAITVLDIRVRENAQLLSLDRFGLASVVSLHPYASLDPQFSWLVDLSIQEEPNWQGDRRFHAAAGGGLAQDLAGVLVYGLPKLDVTLAKERSVILRPLVGILTGLKSELFNQRFVVSFENEFNVALMPAVERIRTNFANGVFGYTISKQIQMRLECQQVMQTEADEDSPAFHLVSHHIVAGLRSYF